MKRPYLPNAWPSLGKTYHVAQRHPRAADENPGTAAQPFKTISAAARGAGAYDRIVIDAGIYREQVPIVRHGDRNVPLSWLVFAAVAGQEVYLKGSDEFSPEWEVIGAGVYRAKLPAFLFEPGVYNPYELPCEPTSCPANYEFDRAGYDPRKAGERTGTVEKVRPTSAATLPETLGQIYVDHEPLQQLDSLQAVQQTAGSFAVAAAGRAIVCHFVGGQAPQNRLVELTVRERCFKPEFTPHWSGLMIQTAGIVAEHAADPGPFSRCRPLFVRPNGGSGIVIRKTFHAHCSVAGSYINESNFSYLSLDSPTILSSIRDGTLSAQPAECPAVAVVSQDGARTWERLAAGPLTDPVANYFLDAENGMLLRHYWKAEATSPRQQLLLQVSRDGGQTWGAEEVLYFGENIVCFTLMKLQNGQFFWIVEENRPQLSALADSKPDAIFFVCRTWLGTWRSDLSGVDWEPAGLAQVPPSMGTQGVDEPQACQLSDGRIFVLFRQAIVLPSQEGPGYPSVKFFSVSEDNGKTWSEPHPLSFDDGKYVYSSTSFGSAFCSSKNNRLYVILNILNRANEGCLPRNVLHIAEVDQETCCVKRNTVAVVEEVHAEHTHLVGYSNWSMIEERETKNLLLFMNLENGPVSEGYDWNSYRYEIDFPD